MGFGMSLRIAPGVRISASGSGIRSSVGPRVARVHVGGGRAGASSGFGPFTASSSTRTGKRSPSKPTKPAAVAKKPQPSKSTPWWQSRSRHRRHDVLDDALERRQAKQLAADSVRAAKLLTSVHLEDFPELSAPVGRWLNEAGDALGA